LLHFPKQLYLASKSPRRAELLTDIGLKFKLLSADIDESVIDHSNPEAFVKDLSLQKAKAVIGLVEDGIIITADTIVYCSKEILGKPKDELDAKRMLEVLSGVEHTVYTGFTITDTASGLTKTDYAVTFVKFKKLTDSEINEYIKTGSPLDKAGAYGIQDGICALFIEEIRGCYYNVMGFPLNKFYTTSTQFIEELKK
jgi:septum formation protein